MRFLLTLCAVFAVATSAQGSELNKIGEFVMKVKKDTMDGAQAFNSMLSENSLEVQYIDETKSADNVWRVKWTAETHPLWKSKDYLYVKMVVRSDVSEYDSINIGDMMDETILSMASVTVNKGTWPELLFGQDVDYTFGEFVYSQNDDLLFEIGSSEQINIGSVSVSKEFGSWEDVELPVLGWKVGNVTLWGSAQATAGWSRGNQSGDYDGLDMSGSVEGGVNIYRAGDHKLLGIGPKLGNLDLNVSAYAGRQEIVGQEIDSSGVKVGVDFENVPGSLEINYMDQELNGEEKSNTTVSWKLPFGQPKPESVQMEKK